MIVDYKIHEVSEYINWIYFFHAWGFQPKFAAIADIHGCDSCRAMWLTSFTEEDRPKASEAMQLFKEANRMLNQLDAVYQTHGVVNIMDANADGDDLLLNGKRFPLLRQQAAKLKKDDPFLCLSDFVRPLSSGITDKIGAFATTVDAEMEQLYAEDDYKRMLVQTLSDRLAEATAEKICFGRFCSELGASAFFGTHTHVQTADEQIVNNMGYITDAGFCGASDGVIGMDYNTSLNRFTTVIPERYDVADSNVVQINAVEVEINQVSGHTTAIKRVFCYVDKSKKEEENEK